MFVRLRERTTLAGGAGTCNSDGGRQDCSPVARFRYTGWPDGSRATSQDGGSDCGSIGGTGVARETMCGSMLSAACCRHRAGSLGSTRSSGLHSGPGLEPERWQNICASQRTTRRTPPMMMLLWSNSKPTRPYTRAPPCSLRHRPSQFGHSPRWGCEAPSCAPAHEPLQVSALGHRASVTPAHTFSRAAATRSCSLRVAHRMAAASVVACLAHCQLRRLRATLNGGDRARLARNWSARLRPVPELCAVSSSIVSAASRRRSRARTRWWGAYRPLLHNTYSSFLPLPSTLSWNSGSSADTGTFISCGKTAMATGSAL